MIKAQNIIKKYKGDVGVQDVTLHVERGEIFGYLGPNGAGKSTTIKMLTGLLPPTSGSIFIDSIDIAKDPMHIKKIIGVVLEQQNLYDDLTVKDNIVLFCKIHGINYGEARKILEQFRIENLEKKHIKHLSKGQRQRVLIARAMVHKPKLLFLDEPTSGLDPESAFVLRGLIKQINASGTTVFLTTHNLEEADELCNHVAFIKNGRIIRYGSLDKLRSEYGSSNIKIEYLENDIKEILVLNKEEQQKLENISLISNFIKTNKLLSIHSCEATIKDVYLEVMEESPYAI